MQKYFSNEIWCDTSDFTYVVTDADKLGVNLLSGLLTGEERGVVTVYATHKVTGRIKTFEVFIKNSEMSQLEKTETQNRFLDLLGNGYHTAGIYNSYTVSQALDIVLDYDDVITSYCNTYQIPKEFVQTVLFRELWCYGLDDPAGDELVQQYYSWMKGDGLKPIVIRTDSSTGLGQIYAETAISALNHADDRGFISLTQQYDINNWQHMWEVWENLNSNNIYNINCCALVILDCQYEYESTVPYEDFFDYSETQIKTIISRYNGTGTEAITYGNECYSYYSIFKLINQ